MHGKSQSSIVFAVTADNLVVCVTRIEVPNATRWSRIGYHWGLNLDTRFIFDMQLTCFLWEEDCNWDVSFVLYNTHPLVLFLSFLVELRLLLLTTSKLLQCLCQTGLPRQKKDCRVISSPSYSESDVGVQHRYTSDMGIYVQLYLCNWKIFKRSYVPIGL